MANVDAIFVPIGGGGLIAGIAAFVKQLHPRVRIVGVEPEDAAAMYESLRVPAGASRWRSVGLFADGVAVRTRRRAKTSRWRASYVDEVLLRQTPMKSAPRSRMSSRTRARCSSRPGALAVAGVKRYVGP